MKLSLKKLPIKSKKFRIVGCLIVLLILVAGSYAGFRYYSQGLHYPVIAQLNKSQCMRDDSGQNTHCYDLKGKLYKVSNKDTVKIIEYMQANIKAHNLNGESNEFSDLAKQPAQQIVDKIAEEHPSSDVPADINRYALYVGLIFNGGLFGEYRFPTSNDGKAILADALVNPGNQSEDDSLYAIKSEFGASDQQAKLIYREAKKLAADEYFVFIAKNY